MKNVIWTISALVAMVFVINTVSVSAIVCDIDVYNLDVTKSGKILGYIKNDGSETTNIEYEIYVEEELVSEGSFELISGKTKKITDNHDFDDGESEVVLRVYSDCGSYDQETIWHTVLKEYSCTNPLGLEGENYCDYYSHEYMECQDGDWVAISEDDYEYYVNCPGCGTGSGYSKGCGGYVGYGYEYVYAGDYEKSGCGSHGYGYGYGKCSEGFRPEYQCDGDMIEQKYVYGNCAFTWITKEECEYGCKSGICTSSESANYCDVSINQMEYTESLDKWEKGYVSVSAVAKSYGKINITLIIDGKIVDSYSEKAIKNDDIEKTLFFSANTGKHIGEVVVKHSCGATDTEVFHVNIAEKNKVTFFQPVEAKETTKETMVSINPTNLDVPIYNAKIVSIDITTAVAQKFYIDVDGVPSGFVNYENVVYVESEDKVLLYVTPTESGEYDFSVTVTAEKENEVYSREVNLFVVTDIKAEQAILDLGIVPLLLLIVSVTVLSIIVVGFLFNRRQDDYIDYLYDKVY